MLHGVGKTKSAHGKRQLVKLVVLSIAPFSGASLQSAPLWPTTPASAPSTRPTPASIPSLPTSPNLRLNPNRPFGNCMAIPSRQTSASGWIWVPVEKCGTAPGGTFRFARTAGSFAFVFSMICTITRAGLAGPGEHNSEKDLLLLKEALFGKKREDKRKHVHRNLGKPQFAVRYLLWNAMQWETFCIVRSIMRVFEFE